MRILIAADTYYPNIDGCSYFAQRLASELAKRGHEVLAIAPSKDFKTGYFVLDGTTVLALGSWPTLFNKDYRFTPPVGIKRKITMAIRGFKPDLVHVQGHFFIQRSVAKIAHEMGIPVMGTNHFMPENLVYYAHMSKPIESWLIKQGWQQFKTVFEKLDLVTTPTHTAVELLKKIGLHKSTIAVSCGIDLARFKPSNNGEYLRERYKLPKVPLLVCVGRLAPEKNIDCVLQALAKLKQTPPAHLVVAGSGLERPYLEKLAQKLGVSEQVTFAGFIPDKDLPNLYPLATAFIMAGTAELQSIATLEAVASGVPILAARALALPELCHDQENGFLFNPGDSEALASAIKKIILDPNLKQRMSQKSLELAREHDIHKTVDQYLALYHELLNAKN